MSFFSKLFNPQPIDDDEDAEDQGGDQPLPEDTPDEEPTAPQKPADDGAGKEATWDDGDEEALG